MQISKFILIIVKALIDVCLSSMRELEKNKDADGIPLEIFEYDRLGFLLASFRDIDKSFNSNFDDYEK